MIATLIPYFLACNISGDSGWPYGPEYVYNARSNLGIKTIANSALPPTIVSFGTAIHCRPKNAGSLNCVFKNTTIGTVMNGSRPVPGLQRFQMDFNEMGVENFTVSNDMRSTGRIFIRIFAPLFTVGSDLSGKTDQDGVFQAMNSTVERFKMNVTIGYPPDTENDSPDNRYRLSVLPGISKPTDKAMEVTKEMYGVADDIYRTIEMPFLSPDDEATYFRQRVEQLENRMKISKDTFESYTHEKGAITGMIVEYHIIYEGFFELKLMDVVPADEPIPDIENPKTYGIFK